MAPLPPLHIGGNLHCPGSSLGTAHPPHCTGRKKNCQSGMPLCLCDRYLACECVSAGCIVHLCCVLMCGDWQMCVYGILVVRAHVFHGIYMWCVSMYMCGVCVHICVWCVCVTVWVVGRAPKQDSSWLGQPSWREPWPCSCG